MTITEQDVINYIKKAETQTVARDGELGQWISDEIFEDPKVKQFIGVQTLLIPKNSLMGIVGGCLITGIVMGVEICKEKIEQEELKKLNV